MDRWTVQNSSDLYNINNWGSGYFRINSKGNVEVSPKGADSANGQTVDLKELVDDLQERGLRSPILIRFSDIVGSRIRIISEAFQKAIETYGYSGKYRGVYPIKVNQQRFLVEDIVKQGKEFSLGLEAGSKPELLVALALYNSSDGLIICNGFKDRDYIETALLSQKLGRNAIIVVDRYSELELIIDCAKELNIRPRIGFRSKLESKGAGKWAESSGVKSKFGLNSEEMVLGAELLKKHDFLGSLELLHFHIGSQVSSLRCIKDSLNEACWIYVELAAMGAGLSMIDVGGGLGVDYDGSQTNWENSVNYSIKEYASDVVWQIKHTCDARGIPCPTIITEAGRALVAHHSALIFNVLGVNEVRKDSLPTLQAEDNEHETLSQMKHLCETISPKNLNEHLQDAYKVRDDALSLFNLGYLTLRQRAVMESMFRVFCTRALAVSETQDRKIEEAEELRKFLIDSYFCNFSVFQSAPDTWAVSQLFPIMPIHRLDEKPTRQGIILDLTCDSDGKIEKFIDVKDVKDYLPLHNFNTKQPYYIGMFLLGAYQEILGDLHNLFGDTDAVHVSMTSSGYVIDHVVPGDTVSEVLAYVEYDRPQLIRSIRESIEKALAQKLISLQESRLLIRHFEDGLNAYTYLESFNDEMSDIAPVKALQKIGQQTTTVSTPK
ncbi:MAG: biosynthetic arginine decarboxylase [bacterium]